jgi:hypothetical protein
VATAVAARGAWQGKARAKATGSGTAQVRSAGARAREFWSSRAAAWPCRARGTGIPSPRHDTAARGMAFAGAR